MTSCLLLFVLCLTHVLALGEEVGEVTSQFKSRPDLYPPVFTLELSIPERLSPGYIFVGPYEAANSGPYIYDTRGNLVWSGWGVAGPGNSHGMHVCQYKGKDHLCFFQGTQQKGYCRGHGIIMDNEYRIVRSVQAGGGMAAGDMHEFLLINDGKTALMTVYQQRQFDMSAWNIKSGVGWLMESIFQEVDVETNEVLFEWRSLDHVDPSDSYTLPDSTDTSGNGLEPRSPWDYFHINSIDKNADGDYLISSRHTCAIYKISGKNGSVLWKLHGARPTFKNINFSFSQQHDARWLFENSTHTLLSLYNNGDNGFNHTHTYSSGMIILIDHRVKTATQLRDYIPPGKSVLSASQGNMQMLPNRNVFMGWGNNPYVSEHDEAGNLLFWGYVTKSQIMNYRAQKFEWEGNPTDLPALWTYSKSTATFSPTTFYVSWNGATRVKYWRFYGAMNITGPYTLLDEVEKIGFETVYTNVNYYPWGHAEAVDGTGKVLSKSRNKFTFVPSPELQGFCQEEDCRNPVGYGIPGDFHMQPEAPVQRPIIPPMGINTVPWVDPEHPENHYDGKQSQLKEEEEKEKAKEKEKEIDYIQILYDNAEWGIVALGGIILALGVYLMYRLFRQPKHPLTRVKEHSSTDTLDEMEERKPIDRSARLSWWHWRRWVEDEDEEPPHYFPLAERHQHDR
ncbi:hypothetical protein ASPWEDRAFT_40230 [Aspergillus wentii DTO 134E9]|uniref:ASST-domain-containing protein n=1 Tax=Aspergillus wentii DTO 134E9 TaxID=1073089 RepID=A0A1L9RJR4_ASPWE|nr:uncharacterized protein ASPWEDRAFT_40230 [Aspergillus wentii DTO 134E9]OJJ35087.1 hypothetical protein ASPWEDRAFT_40230 [Aspergillus wentii DTO 134E9]